MEILASTDKTLSQLIQLTKALSHEEFTRSLSILSNSTIGQHIRHIIEFYIELNNGYISGIVSYDKRLRNPDFETDQTIIISKLKNIGYDLNTYDLALNLKIKSNHGLTDDEETISNSSVMRETVYALDHAVHHLAVIKIALKTEFCHIEFDQNMGVAPSTLRNLEKVCAQ
jgi:hypothetical protein